MSPAFSVDYGVLLPLDLGSSGQPASSEQANLARVLDRLTSACRLAVSPGPADHPSQDAAQVVREAAVVFEWPVRPDGQAALHWWVEYVGRTSFGAGFQVYSPDGATTYAQGRLTMVKVDPRVARPQEWSGAGRARLSALLGPQAAGGG